MDERDYSSALRVRESIQRGRHAAASFRADLSSVPERDRDAWLDLVLGLEALPEDGPELPQGCVPYLPCAVDVLLRVVQHAGVQASDTFVDLGSGVGRAAVLVHLLTGAPAIGIEIQPGLASAARALLSRLQLTRVRCVQGDAADLSGQAGAGTVFLLYCPFGGERLVKVLDQLEAAARTRMLRVCCVDLPLPARAWLTPDPELSGELAIYRSTLHREFAPQSRDSE